ncbi:MAG: ATP-binding protein [Candidatus Berkelbacteria bacterium]|nr:ATP-binding protein [Candidatus Berkelbacteria bacterium]
MPILSVDPKLTRMIIQNLLSNALKYTVKGGVIISISKEKEDILIKVADTGLGIPKEQHDKIFQKLFRADNVRETDTEGTGLGLYIIKSILDNTGGTIRFESVQNKGTTFFVTIPLKGMTKKEGTKAIE